MGSSEPQLTELQKAILQQLQSGKAHAIQGAILAKRLGFSNDREIRAEVMELIRLGYAIASSTKPPYGFFFIQNRAEADEYIATLRSRIKEVCIRRAEFKLAVLKSLNKPKQLSML